MSLVVTVTVVVDLSAKAQPAVKPGMLNVKVVSVTDVMTRGPAKKAGTSTRATVVPTGI